MSWWLLQHLAVTVVLAAAVLMLSRLVPLGPVVRHGLWLVVLLKFMVPPVVAWPWALPDPLGLAGQPPLVHLTASSGSASVVPGDDPSSLLPPDDDREAAASAAVPREPWIWLVALWVAGSCLMAGVEGTRLRRLIQRLRTSAPADEALTARVARLASRLGIPPVNVRVVAGHAPPSVWAFGRAEIIWPAGLADEASDACLDGLLLHELAHVRRRDHLVGWIELAAGIVWWWNPVFWYVRSALREQAELACDAWVISALPDGRRAYAESLLAVSGAMSPGRPSMALVGISPTSRRMLERRLVMIMQGRAPVRLTRAGIICLALLAVATLPGWAAQSQDPPPPPPDPPKVVPVIVAAPRPPGLPAVVVEPKAPPPAPTVAIVPTPAPAPVVAMPRASTPRAVRVEPGTPPPAPVLVAPPVRPAGHGAVAGAPPTAPAPVARPAQVRNGRIQGQVTDRSGVALSGVRITLSSDGLVRPMVEVTSPSGQFDFPIVPVGTYTVTYDLEGFKRVVRTGIVIEAGFQATVNAQLEPGLSEIPAPTLVPLAGREAISQFQNERQQIQREADLAIAARRNEVVATLTSLANDLDQAGRAEEAAAVRVAIGRLQGGGVR